MQQRVGPRVRGDRVHGHADDVLQLLKEVPVHAGEFVDRRELDHAEDLALEQDREHDDIGWLTCAQA